MKIYEVQNYETIEKIGKAHGFNPKNLCRDNGFGRDERLPRGCGLIINDGIDLPKALAEINIIYNPACKLLNLGPEPTYACAGKYLLQSGGKLLTPRVQMEAPPRGNKQGVLISRGFGKDDGGIWKTLQSADMREEIIGRITEIRRAKDFIAMDLSWAEKRRSREFYLFLNELSRGLKAQNKGFMPIVSMAQTADGQLLKALALVGDRVILDNTPGVKKEKSGYNLDFPDTEACIKAVLNHIQPRRVMLHLSGAGLELCRATGGVRPLSPNETRILADRYNVPIIVGKPPFYACFSYCSHDGTDKICVMADIRVLDHMIGLKERYGLAGFSTENDGLANKQLKRILNLRCKIE